MSSFTFSADASPPTRPAPDSPVVGVIGLGYVGLPLAVEVAQAGMTAIGYDVSPGVVDGVNAGRSHIGDVSTERLADVVGRGAVQATTDPSALTACDLISICVPTPLNKIKDPDLSYILAAARTVAGVLRPGQTVVLESTTYPGTTDEVLLPLLEESGLTVGEDVHLCFSPERVDPGNATWQTKNTPKVIGGVTEACLAAASAVYGRIFDTLVPVSSTRAAELVKVYENIFRMVNIGLANELAQACDRLGLDVWEVIDAAATKPFGFMKFTPGPGLGGHCIPLDPHYLAWKMRTLSFKTRLIELASEINAEMPTFVARKVADALNEASKAVRGSRVLVLGIAYKKNIDDLRESPALEIIHLLQESGADVVYHDPFCPTIADDGHTAIKRLPLHSQPLTDEVLASVDAVVLVTDHSDVDYAFVADRVPVIVDTRGAMKGVQGSARILGLSGVETGQDGSRELAPIVL